MDISTGIPCKGVAAGRLKDICPSRLFLSACSWGPILSSNMTMFLGSPFINSPFILVHGRVVPAGIKGAIPPVVRATPIGHRVVGLISTWGFIAMKRLAPAAIRSLSSSTVTVARGALVVMPVGQEATLQCGR